jgi:ankyrin repeat protein
MNAYGGTPLSEACVNSDPVMIEKLLKAGADPNAVSQQGETALMTAARTGSVESVKALLDHGADVNARRSGSDKLR